MDQSVSRAGASSEGTAAVVVNTGVLRAATGAPESLRRTAAPSRFYVRWVKPVLDAVGAAVLLVLLTPVLILAALAVYASVGRPLFYVQQRVGHQGRPFHVVKFRTMLPDRRTRDMPVQVDRRTFHKREDDPRHVPVGRVLRRMHIDELPQLVNVLRGEMSLVGPRPELPSIVDAYESWQHDRHLVRPGITGMWQVSRRGQPMYEHVDLDVAYVEKVSLLTDLRLLAMTVPSTLLRRGA